LENSLNKEITSTHISKGKTIYVLLGPSGSGKTTIGNYLKELGIPEIVTHTTRPMRKGEAEGVSYHFVSKEEFDATDKIEEVCYSGNYYGISRKEITSKLETNDAIFVICDVNGMKKIREAFPDNTKVLFFNISLQQMVKRMKRRGDSKEDIQKRLQYAQEHEELSQKKYADVIIHNRWLWLTKWKVKRIIEKKQH